MARSQVAGYSPHRFVHFALWALRWNFLSTLSPCCLPCGTQNPLEHVSISEHRCRIFLFCPSYFCNVESCFTLLIFALAAPHPRHCEIRIYIALMAALPAVRAVPQRGGPFTAFQSVDLSGVSPINWVGGNEIK